MSNNVLYTLPREQWDFVVTEIKRVLKSDGKLIIANLNESFSPAEIYKNHVKQSIRKNGLFRTLKQLTQLATPTIKMFRFNAKIKRDNQTQVYAFMRQNEQRELFVKYGFKVLSSTKEVYAGGGVLDVVSNKFK